MSRANEPAYPVRGEQLFVDDGSGVKALPCVDHPGLTIREHFAALAMQGLLAGEAGSPDGHWMLEALAVQAVRRADALLAELAKPVKP